MEPWAYRTEVKLNLIRPGKPVENGYIRSFNGRLRDECLNGEIFFSLADVREKDWKAGGETTTKTDRTVRSTIEHQPSLLEGCGTAALHPPNSR